MTYNDKLQAYLINLEGITEEKIPQVLELIDNEFVFSDPFNNIRGKSDYDKVLQAALKDSLEMEFKITKIIREERTAFISWDYSFIAANKLLGSKKIFVQGMSEIRIAESGLISYHKDYWDVASTIYERIPILGRILAGLRKRISISA